MRRILSLVAVCALSVGLVGALGAGSAGAGSGEVGSAPADVHRLIEKRRP